MPRLWSETIDAHRRSVRDAILDATGVLLATRGLASLTMADIAQEVGIGRATLYKYFPDVEAVVLAWHERGVRADLERLVQLARRTAEPGERLRSVLSAYASIHRKREEHHHPDLAALLHRQHAGGAHAHAQTDLQEFLRDLIAAGVESGQVRRDVPPAELAAFCLQALRAASTLSSKAAISRLVDVTLAGLQAPAPSCGATDGRG